MGFEGEVMKGEGLWWRWRTARKDGGDALHSISS